MELPAWLRRMFGGAAAVAPAAERPTGAPTRPAGGPEARLAWYLAARPRYRVWTGGEEGGWVERVPGAPEEGEEPSAGAAGSAEGAPPRFVVSYRSGVLLDRHPERGALPRGVRGLAGRRLDPRPSLRREDLDPGPLVVDFGPSGPRPGARWWFSLRVANRGDEPARVLRFAAFAGGEGGGPGDGGLYHLSTITGDWFDDGLFVEWFDAPAEGWLPPGATVSDPTCYGPLGALWVFEGVTRSGRPFRVGAEDRGEGR